MGILRKNENLAARISSKKTELAAAALILLALFQMIYIINSNSMIADEQFYPGAGKYAVATGDFSPFAFRYHASLPYFINSLFLYPDTDPIWQNKPFDMLVLMEHYGIDNYLFLTRLPIALTVILLGVYLFKWSRELYGDKAAIFAVFLMSFSPLLLANGSLATTDAAAATFTLISMYYLWKFEQNKTPRNSVLSGVCLGLALLTKFTMLILIPLSLLVFVLYFRPFRPKAKLLVTYFALAFLVVWAFYGFHAGTMMDAVHSREKALEFIDSKFSGTSRDVVLTLMNVPIPAPTYVNGALGYSTYASDSTFSTLFFGEKITPVNGRDFWYYHLTAFAVKEPLTILALVAIFALSLLSGAQKIDWKREKYLILPLLAVVLFFSFFVNIKIGLRHLLPAYPFIFMLLGNLVNYKPRRTQTALTAAMIIISAWYVLQAMLIIPYNMSYFNEIVGGPSNGYLYFTDANVDWGQGMKDIQKYVRENDIKNPYIASMIPKGEFIRLYVPDYVRAPCSPTSGFFAVGVSNSNFYDKECYAWLENYEPAGRLGYSVFIYNISTG